MKLVLNSDGYAKSLINKSNGEEHLAKGTMTPLCELTFLRREGMTSRFTEEKNDHLDRTEKNAEHRVYSSSLKRRGDSLLVGFEGVKDTLILGVDLTDHYLGLKVEKLKPGSNGAGFERLRFFQLPIKELAHFGDWLNVMWKDNIATGILGTGPRTHIRAERRQNYRVLNATGYDHIGLQEIGAALVVANKDELLDQINQMEKDYALPRGVISRRKEGYGNSYYWVSNVTPQNIDENIQIAEQGGFSGLMISYNSFAKSAGHLRWNTDYPNGMQDLQEVVNKVKSEGLTPVLHIHYSKAGKSDPYVRGTPDHRLNLREIFTLSKPLSTGDTTVWVEENPNGMTLDDGRRILKVGNELIRYDSYTTKRPYKFKGCDRGILETKDSFHPLGLKIGVLDVDSWTRFVRFDQRTSIQKEVAKRVAEIYNKGGFESIYYDGAEDIHSPDWYYTAKAQLEVQKLLENQPVFGEGASYSHFSWHILTRGNPWDTQQYKPENLKAAIREESGAQAPRMMENFSKYTFVRLAYDLPGSNTIGIQPDMLEYACSRAAAWELPISIWTSLDKFQNHPRTHDNLEIIRRWEDAKTSEWLTEGRKQMLRNLEQEHILLVTGQDKFELVPYQRIKNLPQEIRAFIFERKNNLYVVYWHISSDKEIELPVSSENIILLKKLGQEVKIRPGDTDNSVILPVDQRRYVKTNQLSKKQLITAFQNVTVQE